MNIIKSGVPRIRDPFVLVDNGKYYMYGTLPPDDVNWDDTGWGCLKSDGDLTKWERVHNVAVVPPHCVKNKWAPEVHKYNGAYYMFTTYFSDETEHRGCTILKSDSPEGPFEEITNGHITPKDWDAIDGTFYVDKNNKPWMIFVHEWTCTDDNVGRMAAAKLSDDLTHFVSEPVELFRADDPDWTNRNVTDGCFMYDTEDGQLIMIWSNFADDGYCVGIARSDNGMPDGNWSHEKELLFSKSAAGEFDGGHGMIFDGLDGEKYLTVHSPNTPTEQQKEEAIFVPVVEENGTLKIK